MRRIFTPPASLSLALLGFLLTPISGIGQIRDYAIHPLLSDLGGPLAKKACVAPAPTRSVEGLSVVRAETSLLVTPFQSTATLQGRIVDKNDAVVPGTRITAQNNATAIKRFGETDVQGNYQIAALPVGY